MITFAQFKTDNQMSPETAAAIDQIQVTLNAGGMNTINIVLAFVMYGVSLGIKPGTFVEVFSKPKSVLLGMLCQLVLLPAFTCLLAICLTWWISPMMGLGMILVASCPGGNISNFMSSLAKANVELSVSLTAISTALAVLMTPFNFWLWGGSGATPTCISPPSRTRFRPWPSRSGTCSRPSSSSWAFRSGRAS